MGPEEFNAAFESLDRLRDQPAGQFSLGHYPQDWQPVRQVAQRSRPSNCRLRVEVRNVTGTGYHAAGQARRGGPPRTGGNWAAVTRTSFGLLGSP